MGPRPALLSTCLVAVIRALRSQFAKLMVAICWVASFIVIDGHLYITVVHVDELTQVLNSGMNTRSRIVLQICRA